MTRFLCCLGHVWGTQSKAPAGCCCAASVAEGVGYAEAAMSTQPVSGPRPPENRELPVEELLRRARPLPPHADMVIEGVDVDEGRAFLTAIEE